MFKTSFGAPRLAVAALVTVAALAACAPPTPAPQFTLRFGFFPILDCLPYFVMVEQGFDKQAGLQFEETPYPGGEEVIEAMTAGSVDVAYIGTVGILSAAERGLIPGKVAVVAANAFADPEHPAGGVLAIPSVSSWKDLKGQFIGLPVVKSPGGAAFIGRLQLEGVHDYTFVEIPYANLGLAVAGGNVAAAILPEPFMTQSLLRRDGKLLGWVVGGPPFERMETSMIVFRADLYQHNPQAIKAFLRAHLQTVKWINQNPDKARSILGKRLSLSPEAAEKVMLNYPLDARHDPALLESMQPVLVSVGLLKAPIPARQLYDETLLNEVLAEKR